MYHKTATSLINACGSVKCCGLQVYHVHLGLCHADVTVSMSDCGRSQHKDKQSGGGSMSFDKPVYGPAYRFGGRRAEDYKLLSLGAYYEGYRAENDSNFKVDSQRTTWKEGRKKIYSEIGCLPGFALCFRNAATAGHSFLPQPCHQGSKNWV